LITHYILNRLGYIIMASIKKPHLVEVLEKDFHLVHNKIVKTKDNYLANHEKEYIQAKRAVEATRKKISAAKKQVARLAKAAQKSSSKTAHDQLKKRKQPHPSLVIP